MAGWALPQIMKILCREFTRIIAKSLNDSCEFTKFAAGILSISLIRSISWMLMNPRIFPRQKLIPFKKVTDSQMFFVKYNSPRSKPRSR